VIAAIVYWNTVYMERAVGHLRSTGVAVADHLLAHISPLGWLHISLTRRLSLGAGRHRRRRFWTAQRLKPPQARRLTACSIFVRVSVFLRTNLEVTPL
jgi:hypothetical protein